MRIAIGSGGGSLLLIEKVVEIVEVLVEVAVGDQQTVDRRSERREMQRRLDLPLCSQYLVDALRSQALHDLAVCVRLKGVAGLIAGGGRMTVLSTVDFLHQLICELQWIRREGPR